MGIASTLHRAQEKISASFADPSASAEKFADQRRSKRYSNDFRVSLLDASSRPADEAVRLIDMSARGVAIASARKLRVGDTLGFKMTMGDGTPVDARATVRWSRDMTYVYNYGLEFKGIGPFARFRLERSLKPATFGLLEAITLLLEAATSIIAVLIVADFIKSDPYVAQTLFFCMPVFLLLGLGAFAAWLLKS